MDAFELIKELFMIALWVIAISSVIIRVFRAFKNEKRQRGSSTENRPKEEIPQEDTISFEDMLREIKKSKEPTRETFTDPFEPIVLDDRKEDYIEKKVEKRTAWPAFDPISQEPAPMDELTSKIHITEPSTIKFRSFEEYSSTQLPSRAAQYAKQLRNPENVKQAIVLSEIINRRY